MAEVADGTTRKRKKAKRQPMENQTYIDPDIAPKRIKAIDNKAMEYRDVRDQWLALQTEASELEEQLRKLMKEHEIIVYPIPDTDLEVILETVEEKARVRKRKKVKAVE